MTSACDITVVICTRNRSASLADTLACLREADKSGLGINVLVVDNASEDETRKVALSFNGALPLRLLQETRVGKSYSMNRALDEGPLGEIVVFLDDDMRVSRDWFQRVAESCRRYPEHDIFGGRVHPVFPSGEVPGWARRGGVRWWAFSGVDKGDADVEIATGEWPSGNHFWIRARQFSDGTRFNPLWFTEPDLTLRLNTRGCRGMWIAAARAEHCIQPALLSIDTLRRRAATVGRNLPRVRAHIPGQGLQSRIQKGHPMVWRILCFANLARHAAAYLASYLLRDKDARVERQLVAIMAIAKNWECLRGA